MERTSLRHRASFLALSKTQTQFSGRFTIILFSPAPSEGTPLAPTCQYGLTASKKVGNAVARNLGKRRVRAVLFPFIKKTNHLKSFSVVVIVKKKLLTGSFSLIAQEIEDALGNFLSNTQ